jgi:flagellar biosynthesis component FlhA
MSSDRDPSPDSLEQKAWAVYDRVFDLALGAGQDDVAALELGLRAAETLMNQRIVRPPGSTSAAGRGAWSEAAARRDPQLALRVGAAHVDIEPFVLGMQQRIADEYGVIVPEVVVEVAEGLEAPAVRVMLAGDMVAGAVVVADDDAMAFVEQVLVRHLEEFLTREEVAELLNMAREDSPMVVEELVPNMLALGQLRQVLQNLVKEQVPIRDLSTILNALADISVYTKDPHALTEHVRAALGRKICGRCQSSDGTLKAFMLAPDAERAIQNAIQLNETGQVLMLDPNTSSAIHESLSDALASYQNETVTPVLVTPPKIRRHVRSLIERRHPDLVVMSTSEVAMGFELDVVETIEATSFAAPSEQEPGTGSSWLAGG